MANPPQEHKDAKPGVYDITSLKLSKPVQDPKLKPNDPKNLFAKIPFIGESQDDLDKNVPQHNNVNIGVHLLLGHDEVDIRSKVAKRDKKGDPVFDKDGTLEYEHPMHNVVTLRINADQLNNISSYTHSSRNLKTGLVVTDPQAGGSAMQLADGIVLVSDKGPQLFIAPSHTDIRIEVVDKNGKALASSDGVTGLDRSLTKGATTTHGVNGRYSINTIIGQRYQWLQALRDDLHALADPDKAFPGNEGKIAALKKFMSPEDRIQLTKDLKNTTALHYYGGLDFSAGIANELGTIFKAGGSPIVHVHADGTKEDPELSSLKPSVLADIQKQLDDAVKAGTVSKESRDSMMKNFKDNIPVVFWDSSADSEVMRPEWDKQAALQPHAMLVDPKHHAHEGVALAEMTGEIGLLQSEKVALAKAKEVAKTNGTGFAV